MENIQDAIKNPYYDIKISLLVSSKCFQDFLEMYNNLVFSSKDVRDVEILVKIDGSDDRYFDLLMDSSFQFKILSYPSYHRRYSSHNFFNDLCQVSSGKLIWPLYEDCKIIRGDWCNCLKKYIDNKMYDDGIFNIAIPMDNGKGCKQICGANIVTREWFDFFNTISPFPNLDRWLSELSRKIRRYVTIPESELLSNFPQGNRTLSKRQRKELFYPLLEEYIDKFKKRD